MRLTKIWPAGEDISHYEVTVVFFSCYGAYLLAESLNELTDAPGPFSGLFTLFTATLVAGHYTMHNISPEALTASNYGFRTVAWLSEAVIFFYLGVEVLLVPFGGWDFGFIFLVTVLGFIGRTLVVAALSAGLNCTAGPMCGCTTVRPRIGARSQVCVCSHVPPTMHCVALPPAPACRSSYSDTVADAAATGLLYHGQQSLSRQNSLSWRWRGCVVALRLLWRCVGTTTTRALRRSRHSRWE